MDTATKSFLTSRTLWGVAVSLLALTLNGMGFSVDETFQVEITDTLLKVAEVGGLVFAGWGRLKASKKIG